MARRQPEFLAVARIVRPRGLKGEVAAALLTDFPERLTSRAEVFLSAGRSAPRRTGVRRCWLSPGHGGQAIFHFAGCDSVEAARQMVGLEVCIPYQERAPLEPRQYYFGDLIGCEVWERKEVEEVKEVEEPLTSLGVVGDVLTDTGTPLLVVTTPQGELLIPLAADICPLIDTSARRIEVVLPAGLRKLNP